jgi:hypothetical protein
MIPADVIPEGTFINKIYFVIGQKVLLDRDLATFNRKDAKQNRLF